MHEFTFILLNKARHQMAEMVLFPISIHILSDVHVPSK